MIFAVGATNTDHKHGQQILIQPILMSLAYKVFLIYAVLRNGVFSVFFWGDAGISKWSRPSILKNSYLLKSFPMLILSCRLSNEL